MKCQCLTLISPTTRFYFPFHILGLFLTIFTFFYVIEDGGRSTLSLRMPPTVEDTSWWQFLSVSLVHLDAYHMYNNLILLGLTGSIFELIHGPVPSIAVFWIGGTTGALIEAAWWNGLKGTRLMGASAGGYALVSAHLAHLCLNWKETAFRFSFLAAILFYVTITIIFAFISSEYTVAHTAHWVGFVQGLLVGFVTVKNVRVFRWENTISLVSFFFATAILVSGCMKCGLN